jgi:hypothetical protein
VHNQQDHTWNFIRRGVWTLVEANLGIICACLIVLRKPLARFISSVLGTTSTSRSERHRCGYSGNDAALATVGSSQRALRRSSTRQQFDPEDTFDCESAREDVDGSTCRTITGDVWAGHLSYKMTSAACGATRQNDEMHVVPTSHTRRESSRTSSENTVVDLGITKQVDIQVKSHPSPQHGQWARKS